MCTVDKMLIKGIRSFSPDNQNVVEFYKPLTLIVGQNGAGKTTIIECLKMACAGNLPPNTRSGQSFVHDPKIAGETEVKAQIKLRFHTNTGQPVVIIRSFQLTQKKSSMQYKALDQVLQTFNKETGQKQALTYRCADIDRTVPSLMGVSKAVLDNVIFVHQEESNWPMDDTQTLKRKFDDLFAATKYTKALEALRKLRTEKVQEVKELKLKVEHLKTHKDTSKKLKAEIDDSKAKLGHLEADMKGIDEQIQALCKQIDAVDRKLAVIADLGDQVVRLRSGLSTMEKHNAEMLAKLKRGDLEEDTKQLQEWVHKFDDKIGQLRVEIGQLERDVNSSNLASEAIKEQYAKECKRQGRLAAEAEAHQNSLKDRDAFIRQTAVETGIMTLPDSGLEAFSQPVVESFLQAAEKKRMDVETTLEQHKAAARMKDNNMSQAIDTMNSQISGTIEKIRMRERVIKENETAVQKLQGQISECVVSKAMMEEVCEQQQQALARLEANKKEQENRNLGDALQKETSEIDDLQRQATALRQERDKLSAVSEMQTRRRVKKQELLVKEEQLNSMVSTHKRRLEQLVGNGLEVSTLRDASGEALRSCQAEFESKSVQLQKRQAKESQLQGMLSTDRQQLQLYETQLSDARRDLRAGMAVCLGQQCAEDQYQANLVEHEESSQKLMSRVSLKHASIKMLKTYVKMADRASLCPLCGRDFLGDEEKSKFLMEKTKELQSLPEETKEDESHLQELQNKMTTLKGLQPLWIRFSDLRDKSVPQQRAKVTTLEQELSTQQNEVEDLEALVALAKHEVGMAEDLIRAAVWPIDSLHKEVQNRRQELAQLESQAMAHSSSRTVGDVDTELDAVESQRAQHERAKDSIMRQHNRLRDEHMALSNQYRDAKEELAKCQNTERRRDDLKAQVCNLEGSISKAGVEIQAWKVEHEGLMQQRSGLVKEREAIRTKAAEHEIQFDSQVREARTICDRLLSKIKTVEDYNTSGKAAELMAANRNLEELKERMETTRAACSQRDEQRKAREQELVEADSLRREVQDCLDWRRSKEEEATIVDRIGSLEQQMAGSGNHTELIEELEGFQQQRRELQSKYDMMRGSAGQIEQSLERAKHDLAAPQFHEIDAKYRRHLIEVATMDMANSDLEKYHKALEKALLTFHTTKMSEINKIIKELWQKTYRGQDIDYIWIKADAEGPGHRSYNYRMVMYVNGAELEMKGRCSAGQKVLACLIVRLALAETFCLNCGILALDEPTTNLDAANSASLAEALRLIIEARRRQENFQLIVITHDEQFAQMIGTRAYAEKLWRVTKDQDQHSLLLQEDID
ncbi:unnamed protein product [Ostreobium quekettii]|uniref:DNA repair protein RAD50 n=1 Tax=Ostreobium quekettii TaxID=121088 RepID=A0A8S1J3K6_9CHLO|nr:unnamed protein product [Ostreobium quekettii]